MLSKRRLQLSGILFLPFLLFAWTQKARASETPAEHAANVYAAHELAAAPPHGNLPDYSLPSDKLAKAQHLENIRMVLHFGNVAWGILQIVLLLGIGAVAWMRDGAIAWGQIRWLQAIAWLYALLWVCVPALFLFAGWLKFRGIFWGCMALLAVLATVFVVAKWASAIRRKAHRWVEGHSFAVLFLFIGFLLDLPVTLYGQHLRNVYGFSVQSWLSWSRDQGVSFLLSCCGVGLLVMLLAWIIRMAPRSWWVWSWAVVSVFALGGAFITPYVIDPLFNKFEPLQQTNPALVASLEQVVAKGHMEIPPDRMFLMKASAKVTTLNAYVTGFGASKRVVVWDTSLAKGSPDQILFIFGHESGHYVLNHVVEGILMGIGGLFLAFLLGFLFVQWTLRRYGVRWRIPSQEDWGALAVLMLAFVLSTAISEPIANTISRGEEHAADVYGQEAIHGLVANPREVTRSTFAILGENSLEIPNQRPFLEFWLDNHPATGRRAAFGHAYDPWAPGMEPKYFPKDSH